MTKPTVFIGSSVEHRNLAFVVQAALQHDAHPVVWTQGTFEPSHFTLESLEEALEKSDFAVLICAPDDVTTVRGEVYHSVRDNVIFELGLFIGRLGRKRTFLISPRGADLRLPTDLNGLTPETFDPEQLVNPEAALGPACTKIRSVILKTGAMPRRSVADVQDSPSDNRGKDEVEASEPPPSPSWSQDDYEFQMLLATIHKDSARAEEIDAAYRASALASSNERLAEWEAGREVTKMWSGQRGNLKLIRERLAAFPGNPRLQSTLGRALSHYGEDADALGEYLAAAQNCTDLQLAARITARAIELAKKLANKEAPKVLKEMLMALPVENHGDRSALLGAMRSIADAANLSGISSAVGELAATADPDDIHARFNFAYQYSENEQSALAMLHYEAIPYEERGGMAWNNLGVAYDRLGLVGMAVDAYELSSKDESIADGNLAKKLISMGFFKEAQKRIDSALQKPSPHENVYEAISTLRDTQEEEAISHRTLRDKANEQRAALVRIGEGALVASGPIVDGHWKASFGTILLTSDKDGKYFGSVEISKAAQSLGLMGIFDAKPGVEKYLVKVDLIRFGNAFEGTITRERVDPKPTLLGAIKTDRSVLLRVSDDGSKISGFELNGEERSIEWTRSTSSGAIEGG